MASTLTLFTAPNPGVYTKDRIYDPDIHQDLPNSTNNLIIPRVGSLIIDPITGGVAWWVSAVDPDTYKSTFLPLKVLDTYNGEDTMVSVVSYGNDIFRLFYDTRSTPVRITMDSRLIVYGQGVAHYRVVRNAESPTPEIISRYYDASGQFVSNLVPVAQVDVATPLAWYCTNSHTTSTLVEGERLTVEFYSDHGALVGVVTVFAKQSTILNEAPSVTPALMNIRLEATQQRDNGELYIFEKQNITDLTFTAVLEYDDGHTVRQNIDQQKCFLYGTSDFIASYPGLRQPLLLKYYLSPEENVVEALTDKTFVTAETDIVVVPNELAAGIKISVVPQWNLATTQYVLKYFAYTTDRDTVTDVTAHVTIIDGTFTGDLYGTQQIFTISLDLNGYDPTVYPESVVYQQVVYLKLSPIAALERYLIADSDTPLYTFGVDHSTARRPVLRYDSTLTQYYVPSSLFVNTEAFLHSFYTMASPLYKSDVETGPLTPTHFILRDISSGAMITPGQIPIADYGVPFNITGANPDRYVGTNVIVEFLQEVDVDTTLILYGVPVDVYTGTYIA